MQDMKFFIDTHDHRSSTFPAGITTDQFQEFFREYEKQSREDGVVVLRAHVGLGRTRLLLQHGAERRARPPGARTCRPAVRVDYRSGDRDARRSVLHAEAITRAL
jgi:hypothetical protein